MASYREIHLAQQPALIPLFGGVNKKPRPLDKDVIAIGRARGCDIGLEAPEISTLHCLIYKSAEGFRLRDCGSRHGTRINGNVPRNSVLAEGDIIQIGPFSFAVKFPPGYVPAAPCLDAEKANHIQRARERTLRIALRLRRRLHQADDARSNEIQADLARKTKDLRKQIQHYEQQFNDLEKAERELEAERDQMRQNRETHRSHVQEVEGKLAKRLQEAETEIHEKWLEFQQRCAKDEAHLAELAQQIKHRQYALEDQENALSAKEKQVQPTNGLDDDKLRQERAAWTAQVKQTEDELAQRSQQADAQIKARWAELEERLAQEEAKSAAQDQQIKKREQELDAALAQRTQEADAQIKARWAELDARLAKEEGRRVEFEERLAREEAERAAQDQQIKKREHELEKQNQALAKEQAELEKRARQLQQSVESLPSLSEVLMNLKDKLSAEQAENKALLEQQRLAFSQAESSMREQQAELARMMNELRELQATFKKPAAIDIQALQQENDELRHMLGEYERRLAEAAPVAPREESGDVGDFQSENNLLRQLLQEKDSVLEELNEEVQRLKNQAPVEPARPAENLDLESFEAELQQYRQQLETDRVNLNQEIEQVRTRNEELDEATREMEMAMSKERAELARERMRLDRLRDEVRGEVERMQRDNPMRESLAPVSKLREEINQKKGAAKEEGSRASDRLRGIKNRLTQE